MKVAVTGVGGGVGQSVLKALKIASMPIKTYAIDVQPLSAGLYSFAEPVYLPRIEEPGSLCKWEKWLQEQSIQALIPGSDHDLITLAKVRDEWEERGICHVLVSDSELVKNCRDKAYTNQLLSSFGIPVPNSAWDLSLNEAVSWAQSNGFPLVLKPRSGSASRDVHIISDEEELRFFYKRISNLILQEYLSNEGKVEEYTCAVFVDNAGHSVGTFMARRDLSGGATYRAEISFWPEIHELLIQIGNVLRPRGVLNVQLRMTERGPIPFELNIRCSGTSAIRAYFGYNEPEMLLKNYVLGDKIKAFKPKNGYVLRYWNEIFIDGATEEDLLKRAKRLKGKIYAWP